MVQRSRVRGGIRRVRVRERSGRVITEREIDSDLDSDFSSSSSH